MKKKRFLGILLSLVMVLGLMLGMSLTVHADYNYPLRVGNTPVTSAKLEDTGWRYEPATQTLTLNNYTFTGALSDPYEDVIYATQDLKIKLIGTNSVKTTKGFGVFVANGALTITGSGTLNATGSNGGIGGAGSTITIESGTVNAQATVDPRDGISFQDGVEITGGTVTAIGYQFGISSEKSVIISGGNVTAKGISTSTVTAGIYANNTASPDASANVTITGGTVEATGSGEKGTGIYAKSKVTISGGYVVAAGKLRGISDTVINTIAGTGWTDFAGTTGKTDIAVSTGGQTLDYKKVQFPAVVDPTQDQAAENLKQKAQISTRMNSNLFVRWKGNNVVVNWSTTPSADTYEVWATYCGTSSFELVTTVQSGNKATIKKLKGKKLNKKRGVKAYVVAKQGGTSLGRTLYGHSASPKHSRTNAKKVTVKKNSYSLSVGQTAKIKASTVKEKSSKKLLHNGYYRYISSNPTVATVSGSGRITAVGAGTCEVWVYALNGKSKTVTVNVK